MTPRQFLYILLASATVLSFIWLFFNRERLKAKWWEVLIVAILHTVFGMGCVLLFAIIEGANPGAISMFGGIFFMPLFYFVYAKIKKLPFGVVFDTFLISLTVTLLLSRVHCLYAGCCIGKYIGDSDIRYPTREIEIGFHTIFITTMIIFIYKKIMPGRLYPVYLISYGVFRFTIEWFRESSTYSSFHIAHVWSIIAFLVGTGLLIFLRFYKKDEYLA